MSALHEAARRVVTAWVSTRPAWIEQCNEAVLALDAALKAEPAQEILTQKEINDLTDVHLTELVAQAAQ